ncbi:hypothetical protein ACGFYT_30020 [Streptomyces sp. NPDC048208]|uniref:hypothetical protein n=1 Tax=Streptomyces sp. NPDC048208 TaxID=3365515 RepID=UPI003723CE2C
MSDTFPGQLVTESAYGHTFRHDPGAKGGVVLNEEGTEIGAFTVVEVAEEGTPCGIYVGRDRHDDHMVYADTYDGASAVLAARTEGVWNGDEQQTWAVAYAIRNALANLVGGITSTRKDLASEEGQSAPGVVRRSLENGNAERERLYAQLVSTFATLPEALRPDMRNRLVQLPEDGTK